MRRLHTRSPAARALAVAGLVVGTALGLSGRASGQVAGIGISITPGFQSPVTVGQQDQPAQLQFVNNSLGALAGVETVTLNNIRVNPGCATSAVNGGAGVATPCPTPEPRPDPARPILHLDPVSTAATTCPGKPFAVSGPDAEGDYVFTPTGGPVTLAPVGQPGASCLLTFTFDVVQAPNDGVTFQAAALVATSPTFPGGVPQTGVSHVTVTTPPTTTSTTTTVPPTTTTTVKTAVLGVVLTTVRPAVRPAVTLPATGGGSATLLPGLALLALGLAGLGLLRAVAHGRRTWFAG